MLPLPCWDLAVDYSFRVAFNTRKSTFFPTQLPIKEETRKQDKNSSEFWGGLFVILQQGIRAGMQQSGLFPKIRFMQ